MEKIRFFNDMLMFAQPKEEAPEGLFDGSDDDETTFYKEFSLAPYEFNERKANERLDSYRKGNVSFENTSDPNTMYFGIQMGWDDYEVESRQKNVEYVNKVTNSLRSITNQFKYVKQAFLPVNDAPQYYTAYELFSEDGKNISCVVFFGYMFFGIESWILPGAKKDRKQYFSRNAPLFKQLFDNYSENVDFSKTQFLALSTSGSFINIPVKHNGELLTEEPGSKHFYEDIFSFVGTVLSQQANVQYLDLLHTESQLLNADQDGSANFFTRNRMKSYMIDVADIKNGTVKDEILYTGKAIRYFSLWDTNSDYVEEGEIQELFQLVNTDWDSELSSVVKVLYKYQWNNDLDDISVNLGDFDIKSLFDKFDEYELEYKMPTLYKAYVNGIMGKFTEGALIQTAKITYFRYVYNRKTVQNPDEVIVNVDNACMKILRELTKFVDYVKKKKSKDSDKRTESNTDGILRLFFLSGLNSLF